MLASQRDRRVLVSYQSRRVDQTTVVWEFSSCWTNCEGLSQLKIIWESYQSEAHRSVHIQDLRLVASRHHQDLTSFLPWPLKNRHRWPPWEYRVSWLQSARICVSKLPRLSSKRLWISKIAVSHFVQGSFSEDQQSTAIMSGHPRFWLLWQAWRFWPV